MKLITLYLPEPYIRLLDELVAERFYPNQAEAIRCGVRSILSDHGKFKPKADYKPPSKKELATVEKTVWSRRSS